MTDTMKTRGCVSPSNSLSFRPAGFRLEVCAIKSLVPLSCFTRKLYSFSCRNSVYFLDSSFEPICKNADDRSVVVMNLDPWNFCNDSFIGGALDLSVNDHLFTRRASKQVRAILLFLMAKVRGLRRLESGT